MSAATANTATFEKSKTCRTLLAQHSQNEIVEALTRIMPQFNNEAGRKLIAATVRADASGDIDGGYEMDVTKILAEIAQMMGIDTTKINEYVKLINSYKEKVLPLYFYQVQNRVEPEMEDLSKITVDTIYRAPKDEAFYGIGDERNVYDPYGLSDAQKAQALADGARLKQNGSYAWGMTTYEGKLYWSTNNNYLCMQGYGNFVQPGQKDNAYVNDCWECEYENSSFGKEVYGKIDPAYTKYGDVRPPRIYCYDPATGAVEDITPSGENFKDLLNCQGLRSAGAHNGVVFFGGPSLYGDAMNINYKSAFAAYDAIDGKFISSSDMSTVDGCQVTDVRRWLVYDDVLYVGVRILDSNGVHRGAVLRWYGDRKDPWQFHVVGWMKNEAAELTVFNNKMYVGGWAISGSQSGPSAVMMGPEMPEGGLQPVGIDAEEWPVVWNVAQYEKDNCLGRQVTSVAGFREWRGHLYWGTFAPAFYVPSTTAQIYGNLESPEAMAYVLGNFRQASFWRLDKDNNVELLYGESEFPRWNRTITGEDSWTIVPGGFEPKWGRGGFGNIWTIYAWALLEYKDNLYIGTMDCSNLIGAVSSGDDESGFFNMMKLLFNVKDDIYGYELLRMTDEDEAPKYLTKDGFGNGAAFGIRNFTVIDDELYIGTASPFNLSERGGWHVLDLNDANDDPTLIKDVKKSIPASFLFRRGSDMVSFASTSGKGLASVTLYNVAGQVVAESKDAAHIITLPTSAMQRGTVVVAKVKTQDGAEYSTKIQL